MAGTWFRRVTVPRQAGVQFGDGSFPVENLSEIFNNVFFLFQLSYTSVFVLLLLPSRRASINL